MRNILVRPLTWAVVLAVIHAALSLALAPEGMFSKYPDAAALLQSGSLPSEMGRDFSPLYLLLHRVLPGFAIRVLQSLAAAASMVAVFLIAQKMWNARVGLGAVVLLGASEAVFLYEATFEPDLLIMALNACALAGLVLSGAMPLWTGLLVGASVALRPNNALFVFVCVLFSLGRPSLRLWRPKLPSLALWLLAVGAMAMGPSYWLHRQLPGEWSTTMSVGAVMHMGNRPEGTGMGAQPPRLLKLIELQERQHRPPDYAHDLYRQFARQAEEAPTSLAAEAYWLKKVWAFASTLPGAFVTLWAKKALVFFAGPDGHDVGEVTARAREWQRFPFLSSKVLGLLGLLGALFWSLRKQAGVVTAWVGSVLLSVLLFYGVARYRLTILPAFAVLTAGFLSAAWEFRRDRKALFLWGLMGLLGFALGTSVSFLEDIETMLIRAQAAAPHARVMSESLREGRGTDAKSAWVLLQAAQPLASMTRGVRGLAWNSEALAKASLQKATQNGGEGAAELYLAGVLAQRSGEVAAAQTAFEASALTGFHSALFDVSLEPHVSLAQLLMAQNRWDEALAEAEKARGVLPGALDALTLQIALLHRKAKAAPEEEALVSALHDPLTAHYAQSQAHNLAGNFEEALQAAEWVLERRPQAAVVHFEKARALLGLKKPLLALEALDEALRLFPEHAFDVGLFEEALEEAAAEPRWLSLRGECALRQGKYQESAAYLQQARAAWSAQPLPPWHIERERAVQRFLQGM